MKKQPISRRTVLKGLGIVTIGLPLLEEMVAASPTAARAVPVRAFNVFFGLGIPAPLQTERFDGVLEPLKPLSDKLLIMRNAFSLICRLGLEVAQCAIDKVSSDLIGARL